MVESGDLLAQYLVSDVQESPEVTQMLLDLVVLGLGIQVILGAVQRGKADDDG